MILKRMEIKRILQDQRELSSPEDAKRVFSIIKRDGIPFTVRCTSLGNMLSSCSVIDVLDDGVKIFARKPSNVTATLSFDEILVLEADSNVDFVSEETNTEGRMSRLR